MDAHVEELVCRATGAVGVSKGDMIQQLWSGYGSIMRYQLEGAPMPHVVVKHVRLPDKDDHPRGWNTDLSHERKVRSYQIETNWYATYSCKCDDVCRVPLSLAHESVGEHEVLMVLEDLDIAGYSARRRSVGTEELEACLSWLARFHALFMGQPPEGLWPIGTYWHLDTRPDELAALTDDCLRKAAPAIDAQLNNCRYQTFVHGDAKLANFCFSSDGSRVAAVDFQYIGGGCGMKDVAYFISSCFDERECERREVPLLDFYFERLKRALAIHQPELDTDAVEQEWRALYPVAWTDFYRFLQGWSPGHWKIHGYSERLAREVLETL